MLPATRDEALALAAIKNPTVIAAVFNEDAAATRWWRRARSCCRSVNIVGDVNRAQDTVIAGRETTTGSVIAKMTMPLYEAGIDLLADPPGRRERRGAAGPDRQRPPAGRADSRPKPGRRSRRRAPASSRCRPPSAPRRSRSKACGRSSRSARAPCSTCSTPSRSCSPTTSAWSSRSTISPSPSSTWRSRSGSLTAVDLKLPVKLYDVDVHYKSVRDKWIGFGRKEQ